jgi:hypothetical protein
MFDTYIHTYLILSLLRIVSYPVAFKLFVCVAADVIPHTIQIVQSIIDI